jgi:hypothetical protein
MKNKYIPSFFLLIFLTSCGGGGGSAPFSFSVGTDQIVSTNEDILLTGSFSASTNYSSNITFSISSLATNGNVSINSSGRYSYTPNLNFYGDDDFGITFSATQVDDTGQAIGAPITYTRSVDVTINPVNDSPIISVTGDFSAYSSSTLIFDDIYELNVQVSDVDNAISELSLYGQIGDETLSGTYYDPVAGASGTLNIDMTDLDNAGYQSIQICASDGDLYSCAAGFDAYFISNKQIISIDNSCDVDGLNCSSDDHYLYYLVGSPSDTANTEYVFIGDRLNSENIDFFRSEVLDSVNTLVNSDAGLLIDGFFSIAVIEEVALSDLSAFEIEMGCYPSTPTVYCIGDVNRDRISNAFDYDIAAFISSLSGRGVAQGDINIQQLKNSTEEVVMHELGHSHGYMGDEYNSGSEYGTDLPRADTYINTTSVDNPNIVKWKHFIEDLNNVPGVDYDICYNYASGNIYSRDQVGNGTYEDCECFYNQYPDNEVYTGENDDPDCISKAGVIPGTYYDEDETYRPLYWTVMESGADQGYGKVNIEGFAFGSIMNQGFDDYTINGSPNYEALESSSALQSGSINFSINAEYDSNKVRLKWFKDGVEQTQLQDNTSVSFNRPANNAEVTYSWVVEDLSGLLVAPNDPLDPLDFYEGWFEYNYYYESDPDAIPYAAQQPYVGSWRWYSSEEGYLLDNQVTTNQDYMFAEICCSMSAAIKIKWSNYNEASSTSNSNEGKRKSYLHTSANPNKKEKIFSLNLTKNKIKINSIKKEKPNKKNIRRPFLKKTDIYSVDFFNKDDDLIYQLGIGNPFEVKIQHIGYADKHGHSHSDDYIVDDANLSNLQLVIPSELDPASISLSKRGALNVYNEVVRIAVK